MTVTKLIRRQIAVWANENKSDRNSVFEVLGEMASEAWENELMTDEEFGEINAALAN